MAVDGEIQHTGMAVRRDTPCKKMSRDGKPNGEHECRKSIGHEGPHECWCGEVFTLPTDAGRRLYGVWGWFKTDGKTPEEAEQIVHNLVTLTGMEWTHQDTVEI